MATTYLSRLHNPVDINVRVWRSADSAGDGQRRAHAERVRDVAAAAAGRHVRYRGGGWHARGAPPSRRVRARVIGRVGGGPRGTWRVFEGGPAVLAAAALRRWWSLAGLPYLLSPGRVHSHPTTIYVPYRLPWPHAACSLQSAERAERPAAAGGGGAATLSPSLGAGTHGGGNSGARGSIERPTSAAALAGDGGACEEEGTLV